MNKHSMHKLLSFILCIVLIAAMALFATGCSDKNTPTPTEPSGPVEVIEKGEGATSFTFTVTDLDGTVTKFLIKTDKTVVGDALLELGLITGDPGPYGLYVKTVNGISADYEKDKAYWAFYVDGKYATSGVDTTKIAENTTYGFVKTAD